MGRPTIADSNILQDSPNWPLTVDFITHATSQREPLSVNLPFQRKVVSKSFSPNPPTRPSFARLEYNRHRPGARFKSLSNQPLQPMQPLVNGVGSQRGERSEDLLRKPLNGKKYPNVVTIPSREYLSLKQVLGPTTNDGSDLKWVRSLVPATPNTSLNISRTIHHPEELPDTRYISAPYFLGTINASGDTICITGRNISKTREFMLQNFSPKKTGDAPRWLFMKNAPFSSGFDAVGFVVFSNSSDATEVGSYLLSRIVNEPGVNIAWANVNPPVNQHDAITRARVLYDWFLQTKGTHFGDNNPLFIGDLNPSVDARKIHQMLSTTRSIKYVHLVPEAFTGASLRFAFVFYREGHEGDIDTGSVEWSLARDPARLRLLGTENAPCFTMFVNDLVKVPLPGRAIYDFDYDVSRPEFRHARLAVLPPGCVYNWFNPRGIATGSRN
jgi:hypothetical protein